MYIFIYRVTTTPVTQVLSTQIISDIGTGQLFNTNARLKFTTRRVCKLVTNYVFINFVITILQFSDNEVAENPICAAWRVDE